MGENSKISWTNHTFNIVIGCVEVSEACRNCYARELAERHGWAKWGKNTPRHQMAESYWRQPIKWNAKAAAAGVRARVFCSSLADVFEDHPDLVAPRVRLWKLIADTPWLDWLLLTKRAENLLRFAPPEWKDGWPKNAWPGVTAEDQKNADRRLPELLKVQARVRWVSYEPALGPVDFRPYLRKPLYHCSECGTEKLRPECAKCGTFNNPVTNEIVGVDWIIVGGESGKDARMMDPDWVRSVRAQCLKVGAAFHFKQKGEALARAMGCTDKAGKDPSEWPAEFRVQEYPALAGVAGS